MNRSVAVEAPAKINLRLVVLAREISGYHTLETLFCAVSLSDIIEVTAGEPGIRLHVEGAPGLEPREENLAWRAAEGYHARLGQAPAVAIRLVKRIPIAAGLGGGSSDAAAVLRALDRLHGSAVGEEGLLEIGAGLGSDVPFFLCRTPYALGWSRGERLLSLPPLDRRPVLIANPGIAMPTPAAFQRLAEGRGTAYRTLPREIHAADLQDWNDVRHLALNDLETPAIRHTPRIAEGLALLRDAGADIALLAGSGASIFGVFREPAAIAGVRARLMELGFRTWEATTLSHWPSASEGSLDVSGSSEGGEKKTGPLSKG